MVLERLVVVIVLLVGMSSLLVNGIIGLVCMMVIGFVDLSFVLSFLWLRIMRFELLNVMDVCCFFVVMCMLLVLLSVFCDCVLLWNEWVWLLCGMV